MKNRNISRRDAEPAEDTIIKESFDYTEWREDLFEGMTIEEISKKAMDYQKKISQ